MVAGADTDIYSPFQPTMISEEGPQSSEEGSGLHSPVFGAPYPLHADTYRYQHNQLDVQHTTPMMVPHYDYGHSLNVQQPPMLHTTLQPPSCNSRHVTFSHYSISTRNHIEPDFSPQTSRIPLVSHASPIDFRYPPERRLPSAPSHDHSYTRTTGISMDSDHRPSVVASSAHSETSHTAAESSTSSKDTRKETSSVVIACRQCRSRKIRCDSTRPVCSNCSRRSNECEYDLAPKRRGPDKRPGTRQRSCKKRPADGSTPPRSKRKRTSSDQITEPRDIPPPSRVKESTQDSKRSSPTPRQVDRYAQDPHLSHLHPHSGQAPLSPTDVRIQTDLTTHYKQEISSPYRRTASYPYEQDSYTKSSYPRQLDVNTFQFPDAHHSKFSVPTSPAVETEQKIWWEKIMRTHTLNDIVAELTFLVNNTTHFLAFLNINFLIKRLLHDDERLRIQPAFILACLALAKLMKSSTMEGSSLGLQQAMILGSDAHAAFRDAVSLQWIDATLAEAALVLALFESSAYPQHTADRQVSALISLDNIIRNITLTTIDTGDHDVCLFSPNIVPMVLGHSNVDDSLHKKCACLPTDAIDSPHHYSNRPYTLPWDSNWTAEEIQDEEIRRLCWAALSLVSEYVAQCKAFNEEPPRFFLCDPSNFGILFPGEVLDRRSPSYRASDYLSPKESVWALYCRCMLLWNFCNRFRQPGQDEQRAEQAHEAFLEAQAIEDSLNAHRCNLDTTLIYNSREYIHNFHGLGHGKTTPGPIFKRKQAEDWLFHQDQVIRRVNNIVHQLNGPSGHQLTRRPFRINWFINQLAICLVLWSHDTNLDDALKLAKSILIPIDILNALWPCPVIQQKCDSLRQQLVDACTSTNVELPFPPSYSVPSFLRS
ncbi:hypothetical protein BYT27DRAFT_7156612 [Phlegmacium glaucopus]|nr:hypothetical protein BYT27DRAFT_7156612 [Phlegmacium glaucopus]